MQELVAATWIYNEDGACPERRKADWVWNMALNAKDEAGKWIYSRYAVYLKKPDAIKAYFSSESLVNLSCDFVLNVCLSKLTCFVYNVDYFL